MTLGLILDVGCPGCLCLVICFSTPANNNNNVMYWCNVRITENPSLYHPWSHCHSFSEVPCKSKSGLEGWTRTMDAEKAPIHVLKQQLVSWEKGKA